MSETSWETFSSVITAGEMRKRFALNMAIQTGVASDAASLVVEANEIEKYLKGED